MRYKVMDIHGKEIEITHFLKRANEIVKHNPGSKIEPFPDLSYDQWQKQRRTAERETYWQENWEKREEGD